MRGVQYLILDRDALYTAVLRRLLGSSVVSHRSSAWRWRPGSQGLTARKSAGFCERLTPSEVRFLRKFPGWSGADFAARLATTPRLSPDGKPAAHRWA